LICFISLRVFTGGPLAIHQAASKIRALGGDAGILYVGNSKSVKVKSGQVSSNFNALQRKKIAKSLRAYGFSTNEMFSKKDHFIVPEAFPDLAFKLLQLGCPNVSIWWLSVDNFPLSTLNLLQNQALLQKCGHLCQSAYAYDFVKGQGAANISMLSDEIDLSVPEHIPPTETRKIDFCYLPNKATGAEDTIAELSKRFVVQPLRGMSREEVKQTLLDSKVFLDFGHHPGKDRVPREAALCGAMPVVRLAGAARYMEDVPLPDELRIETVDFFDTDVIGSKLQRVIDNPEQFNEALDQYVHRILGETAIFEEELRRLIKTE